MWRKPSGCSSYGVIFFNSFLEHALIESIFCGLHISFRRLDTFPCIWSVIYRSVHFSCSCTHYLSRTTAQGVSYRLLFNKFHLKLLFFSSPFGRHSVVNRITNNDSWHNRTVSTPSSMRFVCASKHSDGTSIGCLRKKYQTVLISRKQFAPSVQTTPYTAKMLVQTLCLRKLLARVGDV